MVGLLVEYQQAMLPAMLVALAVCGLAWLVSFSIRVLSFSLKSPWQLFRRQSIVGQIVCGVLVLGCVVFASNKRNGSTNSPPLGLLPAIRPVTESTMPHEVSSDEIARGCYLAAESGDVLLADLPDGCVTNDLLRLRGGFDWVFDIAPTNWYFPYRDGYLTNVTVFTRGEVRPSVRQTFFPVPLTNGVSLLPEGRWSLLTNGPSIFRHGVTTNGTLLLDWRSALVGRDIACPTNLQFELARDGFFAVRTTGRSEVYAPVFPFDWDNDGLVNDVDSSPTCADPDAHGTNAAWYNTVCSNVFAAVDGPDGVILSPRHAEVNTNAYYFVDVIAEKGPAAISFTADQPGRLGSPVIVAQAGETNQVPLLIGVTYAVTSSVPIEVSVHADDGVLIVTNDSQHLTINWPLTFDFAEAIDGSNRIYTVSVEPERMTRVGSFFWNTRSSGGGSSCWHCISNCVTFTCSPTHTCAGDCTARGAFAYEEAVFGVKGGMCRCGFTDPIPIVIPSYDSTNGPAISVFFSQPDIIFEEAYQDEPGSWIPRRSTRVELVVSAHGGPRGGRISMTSTNLAKLLPVASGPVILPPSKNLAPGELFYATFIVEGVGESVQENDIVISGTLTDNVTGETLHSEDALTVVRVEFLSTVHAPANQARNRHAYGVYEYVEHAQYPSTPSVSWNPGVGGNETMYNNKQCFRCPPTARINPFSCELDTVVYRPRIRVLSPEGITTTNASIRTYGVAVGHAGGIGLTQQYVVLPTTVSFSQIAVEEVPCDRGCVTGYFHYAFASNLWSHTRSANAGQWANVDAHNRVGGSTGEDEAALATELPPMTSWGCITNDLSIGWMEGSMEWEIPFGWNEINTSGTAEPIGEFATDTLQEFMIDSAGTCGVRKFFNQVKRYVDDRKFLNGIEKP